MERGSVPFFEELAIHQSNIVHELIGDSLGFYRPAITACSWLGASWLSKHTAVAAGARPLGRSGREHSASGLHYPHRCDHRFNGQRQLALGLLAEMGEHISAIRHHLQRRNQPVGSGGQCLLVLGPLSMITESTAQLKYITRTPRQHLSWQPALTR